MGGWCALAFALAHPERVRRLVLADTPAGIMTPELAAALRTLGERTAAPPDELGRHPALAPASPRALRRTRTSTSCSAASESRTREGGADAARNRAARRAPRGALAPGALRGRRRGRALPAGRHPRERRKLADARVVEIPGAGHSPYFERPGAWNRAVAASSIGGRLRRGALPRDWPDWHRAYDRLGSFLALRLAVVQMRIREWLARAPAGPLRVVASARARARDLLRRPRGPRARGRRARAPRRARRAQRRGRARAAARSGLAAVDVVEADAGVTDV